MFFYDRPSNKALVLSLKKTNQEPTIALTPCVSIQIGVT